MNLDLKYIKIQMMFIRSIKVQVSISVFNLCPALFFSILCSSGSAGEKHTHDVLFPPHTV